MKTQNDLQIIGLIDTIIAAATALSNTKVDLHDQDSDKVREAMKRLTTNDAVSWVITRETADKWAENREAISIAVDGLKRAANTPKRFFEILDQLNRQDAESKTTNPAVGLLPDVIAANMYTQHGDIKFGLPVDVALKVTLNPDRYRAICMVIDMDEYNKLKPEGEK